MSIVNLLSLILRQHFLTLHIENFANSFGEDEFHKKSFCICCNASII